MKKTVLLLCSLFVALALPASAASQTYGFGCITPNTVVTCAIGEAQLSVEVSSVVNPNQALFTFKNLTGGLQSTISEIYFDDGSLLSIASIVDSPPSVDFVLGANPGALPGGNAVNFNTTVSYNTEADNPAPSKGVNPGESVGILFNLQPALTYNDVIAAISLSLANPGVDVTGGLRMGLHLTNTANGASAAFVDSPTIDTHIIVPEPGFYGALALGLSGLYLAARRRRA